MNCIIVFEGTNDERSVRKLLLFLCKYYLSHDQKFKKSDFKVRQIKTVLHLYLY